MNVKEKSFRQSFVNRNSEQLFRAFAEGYHHCYEYGSGATHAMRLIGAEIYVKELVRVVLNESATLEKALES